MNKIDKEIFLSKIRHKAKMLAITYFEDTLKYEIKILYERILEESKNKYLSEIEKDVSLLLHHSDYLKEHEFRVIFNMSPSSDENN